MSPGTGGSRRNGRIRGAERGVALILVLWLIVLLTVIAASFSTHSRTETRMAGNLVEREKARLMVETGLNRALLELMASRNEQRWKLNGQVNEVETREGSLHVAIRTASGLLDLNRAERSSLLKLFSLISDAPDERARLTDRLEDWRDGDDLRRLNGAEASDYARAGFAYGCADRDLESVDELGYVMGFDRRSVDRLRPYVTVYSEVAGVDLASAPKTLAALLRAEPISNPDMAEAFDQVSNELAGIDGLEDSASIPSRSYRISIEAVTQGGARSAVDVDMEINSRQGKPYNILVWHDSTL